MTDIPSHLNAAPILPDLTGRHPAVQELGRFFEFEHLPGHLQLVSMHCALLAGAMLRKLPDSPQLTDGLKDLLRAKDWFVRAALPARTPVPNSP